jgi:predicted TIM-barrel fold metal-dependent hydrolase
MTLFDFHAHFFARPFFEALAAQSPQDGSPSQKLERVVEKTGIELPSNDIAAHTRRWVEELDRHGVSRMAAFASLPEEAAAVAEAAKLAPERLVPFTLVNPMAPDAPAKVERLISELGFRGVLMFPAMHHYSIDGPEARAVFEVLERHKAPAFVHCGLLVVKLRDVLGLPRVQDIQYANPLALIPAANAHPNIPFIIPHFGAGLFREALLAGAQCENVHVDTSSTNSWRRTQPGNPDLTSIFERVLDVFGPSRVIFGTDSNVFPAGWRAERLAEQREALGALSISESDSALIFGGNAARLIDATSAAS